MIKVKTDLCIYRTEDGEEMELELEIFGRVDAGSKGTYEYPDSPHEFFIDKILLYGEKWNGELTDSEIEEAEELLAQQIEDDGPDSGTDEYREKQYEYQDDPYEWDA